MPDGWCTSRQGARRIPAGRAPRADAPRTEGNAAATLLHPALLPTPICAPFAVPTLSGDLRPACLPAVPASPVAPVTPRTAPAASRPAPQARVQQRRLRRLEWVRGWPLVQRAPHALRQPASHGLGRQQLPVLHLPQHKISDSPGISPLKWSRAKGELSLFASNIA